MRKGAMVPRPIPSAIAADTRAGSANADSAWAKCVDCRERARCGVPLEPVTSREDSDGQREGTMVQIWRMVASQYARRELRRVRRTSSGAARRPV